MIPASFQYHRPTSIAEAAELLAKKGTAANVRRYHPFLKITRFSRYFPYPSNTINKEYYMRGSNQIPGALGWFASW